MGLSVALLAVLAAAPLAAAQPAPFDLSGLAPNEGVAIGPDTHPAAVNERLWRASQPLSGFPPQFYSLAPLPRAWAPPASHARLPLTTAPRQNATSLQTLSTPSQSLALPTEPRNLTAAAAAAVDDDDGVSSLAVCPNNPALTRSSVTRFASICRVYLNLPNNFFGRCTATFIDATHVLLAGHCVATPGSGFDILVRDGRYGTVCCAPSSSDTPSTCAADAQRRRTGQFNIVTAAVTGGWLNDNDNNDGALLKVARQQSTASGFGVPVRWGSIIANPCPRRRFEWDGFPARDSPQGCNFAWGGRLSYTITTQAPAPCPAANAGTLLQLIGSSCPGMSGGPLWNRVDDFVVGILVSSAVSCASNGRGRVQFTQIAVQRGVGGVFVQALRDLIP